MSHVITSILIKETGVSRVIQRFEDVTLLTLKMAKEAMSQRRHSPTSIFILTKQDTVWTSDLQNYKITSVVLSH